jgi:hypothetical protein
MQIYLTELTESGTKNVIASVDIGLSNKMMAIINTVDVRPIMNVIFSTLFLQLDPSNA